MTNQLCSDMHQMRLGKASFTHTSWMVAIPPCFVARYMRIRREKSV